MIWLFEREEESLTLESRYDNDTAEFVAVVRFPNGRQKMERFKDKEFTKSFKFDASDRSNVKLTFVLEGNKNVQSKQFNINSSTKVLDNVVVTTL